jgi:hypothetical protein
MCVCTRFIKFPSFFLSGGHVEVTFTGLIHVQLSCMGNITILRNGAKYASWLTYWSPGGTWLHIPTITAIIPNETGTNSYGFHLGSSCFNSNVMEEWVDCWVTEY